MICYAEIVILNFFFLLNWTALELAEEAGQTLQAVSTLCRSKLCIVSRLAERRLKNRLF